MNPIKGKHKSPIEVLSEQMNDLVFRCRQSQNAFDGFRERVNQLNEFYSQNRYKVVFIGEPGRGKTTIICNWLGLLQSDIIGRRNIDATSLLATATGRTTVAEVHIRQCSEPSSHIRVEYLPVEQQKTYIKEFCGDYYQRCAGLVPDVTDATAYTDEDRTSHDNARGKTADSPHLEIDRLIRNMVGLPLQPQSIPYPDPNRESQRQEIIGSVLRYGSTEDFCNEMVRRANLDNRQQRDFEIEHGDGFREELARLFRDLNNGNLETASIPKRIDIDLSPDDLDLHLPEYVDEVIDTIGLDASVRDDLQELLKSPSTLCVLVDGLEAPPSPNIRSLLENTFLTELHDLPQRKAALFINTTPDALSRVNGADGDVDLGKTIKRQEIDRVVTQGNIPYNINNTLFENPCGAYEIAQNANMRRGMRQQAGRRTQSSIIDYYADEAEAFRQSVDDHLGNLITSTRRYCEEQSNYIQLQIDRLKEFDNGLDGRIQAALEAIISAVRQQRDNFTNQFDGHVSDHCLTIATWAIYQCHWATARAANRRYGGYRCFHHDIYQQIRQAGQLILKKEMKPRIDDIKRTFGLHNDNEEIKPILDGLLQGVAADELRLSNRIGEAFLQWSLELFAPRTFENPFWNHVQGIVGRGYHSRVYGEYLDFIGRGRDCIRNLIRGAVLELLDNLLNRLCAGSRQP